MEKQLFMNWVGYNHLFNNGYHNLISMKNEDQVGFIKHVDINWVAAKLSEKVVGFGLVTR
jgi:hypothetical protein